MAHPDLPAEQAYVDRAYERLDEMRAILLRTAGAGATDVAAEAIEAWAGRRLVTFADAERGLCFGRIDNEGVDEPLYVGRRWVHDDEAGTLVVNWQAPAARPFYTATPAEPHGVKLRRRFRTRGRALLDLSDEALDGSLVDAATAVDDLLLEELERARDARMRDIVATIQADQYRLIAREPEPPLVVQGGPGTGKTAVGLHRASFLLYTHREELRRVLVVGPNPTFMDYVSHVLPTLGEESVDQRAVGELVEGVEVTLLDPHGVQRLKADARLGEVVRRAVELRSQGEPEELVVRLEGTFVGVEADTVAELIGAARAELGLTAAARERFRMNLLRRFYADYGAQLGGLAVRSFDEVERTLRKDGRLNRFLERVWPAPRPEQVVCRLLTSRARLAEAAEAILDPDEQALLRRARSGWSDGDLPLLDEARALVDGAPRRYGHVIVDEAQDLTPMQLRMIARRAAGAFTILGDVAQATGPVPYGGWDELLPYLPGGDEAEIEELRHAYRVPREIVELALPLLERISPGVQPPLAYRTGAEPPRIVHGDPPLPVAFQEAARLGGEEGLLVVIAPRSLRRDGDAEVGLFDETRIPVLTPREAKGLEFDHVIVVEPALIVSEAVEGQGLRELYVALTRPTRTLVVVHARPLPAELGAGSAHSQVAAGPALPHTRVDRRRAEMTYSNTLTEALDRAGVAYELLEHARTDRAADEAVALGLRTDEVAKTIVVTAGAGNARVVVPAAARIDMHKLRDLLDAGKELHLLSEEALERDYPEFELGAVPPIGGREDVIVVDRRVADLDQVVFEAGTHDRSVRLAASDLVSWPSARVADVSAD